MASGPLSCGDAIRKKVISSKATLVAGKEVVLMVETCDITKAEVAAS